MSIISPTQAALDVYELAERVLDRIKQRRAMQLARGEISQAQHDRDIAAATQLRTLGQNFFLFGDDAAPLN